MPRLSRSLPFASDKKLESMISDCNTFTRWIMAQQKKVPAATGEFTHLLISAQSAFKAINSIVRRYSIGLSETFVLSEQKKVPQATGELTQLINSIQAAVKGINNVVRKAGLSDTFGVSGAKPLQGEDVRRIEIIADNMFINMLKSSYTTCALVSEDHDNIIYVESDKRGKYVVCFNALDGSHNLECLSSLGSTFAVFRANLGSKINAKEILKPGKDIICAGYAIYGSATMMVLSLGHGWGVNGFILDPQMGEFLLTDRHVSIPGKGKIYSINEGYSHSWDPGLIEYIRRKKDPKLGKPYSLRYVGSIVADVHRTLKFGGIFMYPTNKVYPMGKLKLLYECFPLAFIIKEAGGLATDGRDNILEILPQSIHQTSPIFLGSQGDIEDLMVILKQHNKEE